MINIKIFASKIEYDVTLSHKVTVIRGDSGTGKSVFTKLVSRPVSRRKITISDSEYTLSVPRDTDWYSDISTQIANSVKSIFVLDDVDYITSEEFSHLFKKDKLNFYIIINRFAKINIQSLSRIPFSMDNVFRFELKGKCNTLVPFYKTGTVSQIDRIDYVIVEDSNSGYQYFSALNNAVISANGKDKVISALIGKRGNILLLVDRAAFGNCFELVMNYARRHHIYLLLPAEYHSFEYMLLTSKLFLGLKLNNFSNGDICRFASHEQLYTQLLCNITFDTAYQYSKLVLSPCYTHLCCDMPARHRKFGNCGNNAMNTPKEDFLFKGTKFEYVIRLVKSLK